MKTVLIVGMGQIGSSIYEIYTKYPKKYELYYIEEQDISSRNLKGITNAKSIEWDDLPSIDYMHVCIPYNEAVFKLAVSNYIKQLLPALTIIHSTIDVGTTRAIYKETGAPICYSPCMGVHPNLTQSLLTFEKIVSGVEDAYLNTALLHFKEIGIKTKIYSTVENAEAAKLMCTTYYGWNIIFMKQLYKFCEQYGLNFDEVYKDTNNIYNAGYEKMGMPHVRRPVLKYVPNKIGGHCVTPNCRILKKYFTPAKIILEMDE